MLIILAISPFIIYLLLILKWKSSSRSKATMDKGWCSVIHYVNKVFYRGHGYSSHGDSKPIAWWEERPHWTLLYAFLFLCFSENLWFFYFPNWISTFIWTGSFLTFCYTSSSVDTENNLQLCYKHLSFVCFFMLWSFIDVTCNCSIFLINLTNVFYVTFMKAWDELMSVRCSVCSVSVLLWPSN